MVIALIKARKQATQSPQEVIMAATYIGTEETTRMTVSVPVNWPERMMEAFWFTLCLALFMVLGPFAAPIVLCYMFSNTMTGVEMREPEAITDNQ
jgi:hypothetical protein